MVKPWQKISPIMFVQIWTEAFNVETIATVREIVVVKKIQSPPGYLSDL